MPDVKRQIKVVTEQSVIEGKDSGMEGFPLRRWSMKVVLIHAETKAEVDATIFDKVTYVLHPSFGDRARQVIKTPPFLIAEEGWGEFELEIILTDASSKDHTLHHDLNFASLRYETKHTITFKNPKPNSKLLTLLAASGADASTSSAGANGQKSRSSDAHGGTNSNLEKKKRKPIDKGPGVDMDKLADGLQKLGEDDLLQVVQMVHDNKSEDSWMRNDVEQGEFHVDLYTLPDSLIKMLWEFTNEKVGGGLGMVGA